MRLLTEHAEIEELGNGREQQAIGIAPIAYRRNGSLTRIVNQLGASGDPSLPLGVSELVNFRVRDRLSGNAPLVHFGKGQSHVRFTPLNTNNINGVVAGNTVTFPNAWNNADLRLSIGGHILHKRCPLRTGHPRTWNFRFDDHQNFNFDTLSSEEFRILPPSLHRGIETIPLSWVKSVQGGKNILSVTLPDGDFAGWELDPTITLQPGSAGIDTLIQSNAPNNNWGAYNTLAIGQVGVGTYRGLIKFDLSSIPSGALVSAATLSLYCLADASTNARTFRVFRQKRAWTEGTGSGSATGDGATWDTYDGSQAWQTAGGFGANDCEQTDIGSRDFTASETVNEFKDFVLIASAVQAWIAGTFTNNGALIKPDTEDSDEYDFASSDNATAGNRPSLAVGYVMPRRGMFHFQGWRRV